MKIKWNSMIVLVGLVAIGQAQADSGNGDYVGFTLGQATVEDYCDGAPNCDDEAGSFRVHGGTRLNDLANLEFGYRYIDEVSASGGIGSGIFLELDTSGHFVDATLQLGLPRKGPFKIFSKFGAMYWRLDLDVSATNGFSTFSDSDSESGFAFRTGLGASYQVNESLRLRADWDFLVDVGDEDETGETDINVFSVGPEFTF